MKMLKFDSQFLVAILEKDKRSTIRRDTTLAVGDVVQLVALLPKAGGVEYANIKIVGIDAIFHISMDCEARRVFLNNEALGEEDIETLMNDNGWQNASEGFTYYKSMYGKSFDGVMIQWI